jgi:hypothetical protein
MQMPVEIFAQSAMTQEAVQYIITQMTTAHGPEQISLFFKKNRAAKWAKIARIFMEYQHFRVKDQEAPTTGIRSHFSSDRSDTFEAKSVPFRTKYCGGFGGTSGPSAGHVKWICQMLRNRICTR